MNNQGSVSLTNKVTINNLVINDQQVLAFLKSAADEGRDLEVVVTQLIELGAKAMLTTGVNIGLQQLAEGIDRSEQAMSLATAKAARELQAKLEGITGEDGALAKSLEEMLGEFSAELEKLAGDEKSPLREGIKSQFELMLKAVTENVNTANSMQRGEIARMLDIENPQSPLRLVSKDLDALAEGLKDIQDAIKAKETRLEVEQRSAIKGGTYEQQAIDDVAAIARASSDEPLATGGTPGRGASKKGDGVVRLREGLTVSANLVVEAKNMSSQKTDAAKLKYWTGQAEGARKTRNAVGFLGLCKNLDDMPGRQRIIALDKLGQNIVLAYDPDKNELEMLALVYQVVKMHCLSILSTGVEINPAALNSYVQASLSLIEKFSDIDDAVRTIKKQGDKILASSEGIRDELATNLRAMRREIAGTVDLIELSAPDPFELEAAEPEDDEDD
jgi:hypothetical protein